MQHLRGPGVCGQLSENIRFVSACGIYLLEKENRDLTGIAHGTDSSADLLISCLSHRKGRSLGSALRAELLVVKVKGRCPPEQLPPLAASPSYWGAA